mmetsp:Transcript_61645/g.172187  ORF Transcript_61645/g.172187 Transcript_61645/m.172187 type:complete len:200 (-) Transcript_61645:348-947(-)
MVVLPQEASDSKPCSPQVLHKEVQIRGASVGVCIDDLQPDLAHCEPLTAAAALALRSEAVPPRPLRVGPKSRDIHFREVDILALSALSARHGRHPKQCVLGVRLARDVYQHVLAGHHQVEPLAMDILQVRIPNGSSTPSSPARGGGLRGCRRRGGRWRGTGRRAGRRTGRRAGRSRRSGHLQIALALDMIDLRDFTIPI